MTDETCKGCGAIVELDELRRDQLLECGECVTASNKLRRQLTAARKRIAELEGQLGRSTVHRISLLPTYPGEDAGACRLAPPDWEATDAKD